jgi:hypothetical protein
MTGNPVGRPDRFGDGPPVSAGRVSGQVLHQIGVDETAAKVVDERRVKESDHVQRTAGIF